MNLFKKYIEQIIVELSYRVGAPDLTNRAHVGELMGVMRDMQIPTEISRQIHRKLLNEVEDRFTNPILNKTITYTDSNGEQKSNTVGNLLTLKKEHPGRVKAEQALQGLSKEEYDAIMGDVGNQGKTGTQKMKDTPDEGDASAGESEGPGTITGRPAGTDISNPTGDFAKLLASQEDAIRRSEKTDSGFSEDEIRANFENSVKLIDGLKELKWEDDNGDVQEMDVELTDNGGILIGVMHNTDGKYDKQIKALVNQIKKLPPNTKVMYVGEGGMERNLDNSIDFSGEMGQIRDGISNYFKQFQETSWDDRANVKDTSSKVFDAVAKSLGDNPSKSKAAIWSNMVAQGDDLDPNVYLDRDGKEWLIAQAKRGGSGEFDRGVDWSNLTDAQKQDLYQLNYRDDEEYGETEIYKAQLAYNEFRQSELDKKIKEAEEQGYVVIAPMGNSHIDMWRGRNKEVPKETPEVETPEDMKQIIPKADYDVFNSDSDITKIDEKLRLQISTKLDGVYEKIKAAKDAGEEVPNYNLCKVTIPGTNLYCDDNQGIPRDQMPQFKGKPVAGSPAAKLKVDASGEVDTEPVFKSMLVKKQIRTVKTTLPSDKLKATQSELVGEKVLSMVKALEVDPNNPGIKAPIYVSRDGYVVDGHHRWAAATTYALKVGKPADMDVIVVDQDIKDLIPMANKFAEEIGIAAKKADANDGVDKPKEEPKVTDDPLGAEATMDNGKKLYHIGKGYYSDKPGGNAKYIRVESVVERVIETDSKRWWKLLFAENITATVQGGKDGVFKEIPKDDQKVATKTAKADSNKTVKSNGYTGTKNKTLKDVNPTESEEYNRELEPTDEEFDEKNRKNVNPTPPEPISLEGIVKNPKFPKRYIKVLERMINSRFTNQTKKWEHFSNIPGGAGLTPAQAGELMTLMGSTMSDDEWNTFKTKILKHEAELKNNHPDVFMKKNKNGKYIDNTGSRIVDSTWVKAADNNRKIILKRLKKQYGDEVEVIASAWDTQSEVESLGMENYKENKGFSSDIYLRVRISNGEEILDEISLKKSELVNFLNSGAGKFAEWLGGEIPDEINQNVYRDKQRNDLVETGQKLKSQIQQLLKSDSPKAKELQAFFKEKKVNFETALSDTMNGNGSRDKSNVILQSIKTLADWPTWGKPGDKGPDPNANPLAIQHLKDVSEQQSKFIKESISALANNPKMKEGMLQTIREEFPLKSVSEGEETMAIGDMSLDKLTMEKIFGTSDFNKIKEKLVSEPGPPPFLGYKAEVGSEVIPIAEISVREDGVGYGGQFKFEMQLDSRFAKILKEASFELYG
jgi:hypothetical protein